MRISIKTHINNINELKERVKDSKSTPLLLEYFEGIKQGLHQSRFKERELAMKVLDEMDYLITKTRLDSSILLHEKINELQQTILQMANEKSKDFKPAKLAIFLGSDYNDAISSGVRQCVKEYIPFISSLSVFSGWEIENPRHKEVHRSYLYQVLQRGWKLYQQIDKKLGEQFLVCLPYPLKPEDLDLVPNPESGSVLVEVKLEEALNGPHDRYRLDALGPLLSGLVSHDKLISLHAHGSTGRMLGLESRQMKDLLELLKNQRCRTAGITSCFSGGLSTLPVLDKGPSFPLIVRSIGDYKTFSGQSDAPLTPFFSELEAVMSKSGGDTSSSFSKAITAAEKGKAKKPTNLMQVYFPQRPSALQGFRALSEWETSDSLTITKLRRAQIAGPHPTIPLVHLSIYSLYPPFVDATLFVTGKVPALLSSIPGKAWHYIQEIQLKDDSLEQFIKAQKDFYQYKPGVEKAFFIKKMSCQEGTYENVVIYFQREQPLKILYKKGHKYFLSGEIAKPITPFRYAVEAARAYKLAKPSAQALRLSTAGQQSEKELKKTWIAQPFEGDFALCNPVILPKMTLPQANRIIRTLSPDNKGNFLYHLIANDREDLVERLAKRGDVPLGSILFSGRTLLHLACIAKSSGLLDYLLTQPIDINAQDAEGNTPLHIALKLKNREYAQKLLACPHIDLAKKDQLGNSLLFYGASIPEVSNIFLEKEHSIAELTSVFAAYCGKKNPPMASIKALLKAGADPNLGAPTACEKAFKSENTALVEFLLEHGAKPFETNQAGRCPFIELLKKAPRSQLVEMIRLPQSKRWFHAHQEELIQFILVAKKRRDSQLIQSLVDMIDRKLIIPKKYKELSLHHFDILQAIITGVYRFS